MREGHQNKGEEMPPGVLRVGIPSRPKDLRVESVTDETRTLLEIHLKRGPNQSVGQISSLQKSLAVSFHSFKPT